MSLPLGKILDMPHEDYLRDPGVSASKLKLLKLSPAAMKRNAFRGSNATRAGSWLHTILKPDEKEMFLFPPNVDFRTKANKTIWYDWAEEQIGEECDFDKIKIDELVTMVEEATGRVILRGEAREKAEGMLASIESNSRAMELLHQLDEREVSVFYNHPEYGLRCKLRYDCAGKSGNGYLLGDIKSTRNAAPHLSEFEKSIINFGYDVSAAFYVDGVHHVGMRVDRFIIIAVESVAPHEVVFYELSPALIELGRKKYKQYLDLYARCVREDNWPGYAPGVHWLDVPSWAKEEEVE